MFETSIFLLITAVVTLPSLISHKTKRGEELLKLVIFVQGTFGVFLLVWMGLGLFSVLFTSRELFIETNGITFWIILFASRLLVFASGCILAFGLVQRILMFSDSKELAEKCRKLFLKFVVFQTSVGFLCLITGIWDLVYESQILPVFKY
ncbi:MAG: hypothetical protein JW904_04235 [Spirochaetales bacterium]|nr:hypothetical protein [Spirochaetales bacterium]